jgi:hypothetical protein
MTIAEQLGNVGSEYERALRWKQRGNVVHFEQAFARLLEPRLTNATRSHAI